MSTFTLPPTAIASTQSALYIASGPSIHAQDLGTNTSTTLSTSSGVIRKIALSQGGQYLASIGDDKSLRIFSTSPFKELSSRITSKRCSDVSFTAAGDILVSDKVGDVYRYPLEPRPIVERPTTTILSSDPSKNPDADLVLGHVSINTAHLLSPDGKHILSADRDEHIRVSRYPQAYVIERYLLGSDGFVSAIHIPSSRPDVLLSAGGEDALRIWKWEEGVQVGSLPIWDAVVPHRKVRSTLRKLRKPRKTKVESTDEFYTAPEGFLLPSGVGVCVGKIETVVVGEETIVVFYSEGSVTSLALTLAHFSASAIHAFVLPTDLSSSPTITTLALPHPVVDFASLSSSPSQLLVSVDPAFGVLRHNQTGSPGKKPEINLTAEQSADLANNLICVEVGAGPSLSVVETSIIPSLRETLASSPVSQNALANTDLYPNLSLLPRWVGFEEEDELAGKEETEEGRSGTPDKGNHMSLSMDPKKEWTREELENLGPRQLGRLKAQGVDVGDLLSKKRVKRIGKEKKEVETQAAAAKVAEQ